MACGLVNAKAAHDSKRPGAIPALPTRKGPTMEYTVKVKYGNAWKIVAFTRNINTAYRIASLWDMQGFVAIVSWQLAS